VMLRAERSQPISIEVERRVQTVSVH